MLWQIFRGQFYKGLHGYRCYLNIASLSLTPFFKTCHVLTLCIGSFRLQVTMYWLLRKTLTCFVNMYCEQLSIQCNCQVLLVDRIKLMLGACQK